MSAQNGYQQSLENSQSEQKSHQSKVGEKKKKRISRDQAKKQGKKIHKCIQCQKDYLSYPALYKHCKDKHPKVQISSKIVEKGDDGLPIQKMSTLLRESLSHRCQEIERNLIAITHRCSEKIIKEVEHLFPNLNKVVGKFNRNYKLVQQAREAAKVFAFSNNLDAKIFENNEVFIQVKGKFATMSFGGDLMAFFVYSDIAPKLYLQLLNFSNYQKPQQTYQITERKIWGLKLNWNWLYGFWSQWKKQVVQLNEIYAHDNFE